MITRDEKTAPPINALDLKRGTVAERFTQAMDSIPWVRCASGNVFTGISIPKRKLPITAAPATPVNPVTKKGHNCLLGTLLFGTSEKTPCWKLLILYSFNH